MALLSNFSVNRRNRLCGAPEYASANAADFLELAENGDFWIGNVSVPLNKIVDATFAGSRP
jgi:hypothetical protein